MRDNGIAIDSSSAARGSICAKGVSDCLTARESGLPKRFYRTKKYRVGSQMTISARRFDEWYRKW